MVTVAEPNPQTLSAADHQELAKLVNEVALSDKSLTLYAIAPESAPDHPVVQELKARLSDFEEPIQFLNFFYSDNSLFNFLAHLNAQAPLEAGRRIILAFGLEQLPTPRLKQELEQLNLAREKIFEQDVVLVFWLNQDRFLDEFRNRAPDFWDWRGGLAQFETRHPLLYPYLEWLIAENSYLTMSGVMQVNRQVDIFLDQIYVSLKAERRQQVTTTTKHQQASVAKTGSLRQSSPSDRKSGSGEIEENFSSEPDLELRGGVELEASTTKTVTETVDLADVVRDSQTCSVILGAPGAGKTTLLKYLALHFAKALRDSQEIVQGGVNRETLGPRRWPIYFKIADYAEQLESYPDLGLLEYLQRFYGSWEDYFDGKDASGLSIKLLELMQRGNCLILLDGLDEVFDQDSRRQIVGRINEFAEQFGHNNKLIVTSRIAGYQEVKLASRFTEFTITDMSDDQVSEFLHRWCRAVEQAQKPDASAEQQYREGDRQAEQILSDIQKNAGVKRLTTNPLLLTILALIHRNGEQLPARRVKLYELAVQTLTADWQLSKKLPNMQKVLLPEGEIVGLLAPLAYWMHEEKPSGQVTHGEVLEQLAPKLAELRGEAPDSAEILGAVEEFLRRVRETTGLFVERAPDVYGFMHLTFEEYFAARDIADRSLEHMLAIIQQHWHEPRWVEPILLALGYFGSYSPRQFNQLIEKLFESLATYQAVLGQDEIKLLGGESPKARLQWSAAGNHNQTQELSLQDLLFAGQVIAQVAEVNAIRRKKVIDQLVATGLALAIDPDDVEEAVVKQVLQLLQQIEQFHQQGEVVDALQRLGQDVTSPEEVRLKAQVAKFYVVCGEAGASLTDCITELVDGLEPNLFCALRDLVNDLGAEISPVLEALREREDAAIEPHSLTFMTAMTYVREKHYDKAISLFELLSETELTQLNPYIVWSLATCYQEKENYEKANDFYQICFEQLAHCIEPNAFLIYWRNRGVCQRLHGKYEQALNCFQQMLAIAKDLQKSREEAFAFFHLGRTYQEWSKYEEAIRYHEQSRDLFQQLNKVSNVANQWGWLANTHRDWGQYEQALSYRQRYLDVYKELGNETNVALAYYHLGRIYQAWGKYAEAIAHFEQSRDLYQQLEKESDVADTWFWIANCYLMWGQYEQALTAEKQELALFQKLSNQSRVALAHYQSGLIYQAWGKYAEAIAHYEQSRELYQKLGQEPDVANQWYQMAICYRKWGRYEQALETEQQDLVICKKLDNQPQIARTYYQLGCIYQAWGKYADAIARYEQSRDLYQQLKKEADVANQWYWIAACYRDWGQYEQALAAEQQDLALRQKLDDKSNIADAYYHLGRIYQAWGKYADAIAHYEQSRDLYQQLEKEADVANLWSWIAACYRDWGQYKLALAAVQQDSALGQKLGDQPNTAAYWQIGRIYQAWGKYTDAIAYYEQSRDLCQQVKEESDVANRWYWIAVCYRDWGQYEQALVAEQQELSLRQKLNDQPNIADALCSLGRIYQAWGKYADAIAHYEQSRDLYQQLEREANVANQWYWIADCYGDWGQYEKALAASQQALALRQKLDNQPNVAEAYSQLGWIYQAWGRYAEAIAHYEQSRDLYQQSGKEANVANQWAWIADCYRSWGQYEQALATAQQCLALQQKLEDQSNIAQAYSQLGWIYQAWKKYAEAITFYEQSRDLFEKLDLQQGVANQLSSLAVCYRYLENYPKAIAYYQKSIEKHQVLGHTESVARRLRQLAWTLILQAKDSSQEEAISVLQQAESNLQQAFELDIIGDYHENLAYDHIALALLTAEQLRWLPPDDGSIPDHIAQFEQAAVDGFARFTKLGQTIDLADEALDIARAYLEIGPLVNLDKAEELARQSLKTFQTSNRRKLQAAANKLLGEVYLARARHQDPKATATAAEFLATSLTLYGELNLTQKASDLEALLASMNLAE